MRRTWSAAGFTPLLHRRLRAYKHLSAIGALSISPGRRRLRFVWQLHRESIKQPQAIDFLRQLLRHFRGPIVLVWDRLSVHRGARIREFVARHPRLHLEYLPPYAPELNPLEYGWGWLKTNPLANRCAGDLDELTSMAEDAKHHIAHNQRLLAGFMGNSRVRCR